MQDCLTQALNKNTQEIGYKLHTLFHILLFNTAGPDTEAILILGKKYEAKALFLFLKSTAFRCVRLLMFLTQPDKAPRSSGWIIREAWNIEKFCVFFFHSPFVLVWRVITLATCQTKIYESALSKLRVSPYHQTHCCPGGLGSCLHPFHLPSQSRQPSTPGGRKSTVIQCSRKQTGGLTQMKLLAKSKSENRKEAKK